MQVGGRRIEFNRNELAGGLGDLGLLVPIAIALITVNGLSATAVFGVAGLSYLATSFYFGVPFPVQPLKAFAAIAIATGMDAEVIAAGALMMSAAMALLASSGLAGWLTERFPTVLVRGVQASIALLLVKASFNLVEKGNWRGLPAIDRPTSWLIAFVALALLFTLRGRSLPGTLAVLGLGAAVGLVVDGGVPHLALGPDHVAFGLPRSGVWWQAFSMLVVAQIPLTFGNSVVATVDAERRYFGAAAARVRPNRVAGSIAFWNLIAGVAGGLPVCHGAGGVTAHAKLGARTAGATLMTGALLLVLGIGFGRSLPLLLQLLAPAALAGMLFYVAIQHAALAAEATRAVDRAIALAIGVTTLVSGNLAIGFALGVGLLLVQQLLRRLAGGRPVLRAAT